MAKMSGFTYGFYDSLNHDRRYNALQMSSIFDGIIEDGVYANYLEQFRVEPGSGMNVIVKPGRAWFNHTWTLNTKDQTLKIDPENSSLTRIDSVMLTVNRTTAGTNGRTNYLEVVKGAPATSPKVPMPQETEFVFQHILAHIYVRPGASSITKGDIVIDVGKDSYTPFVANAVGAPISADAWFNDWKNDFDTWFDSVKGVFEGDPIGNIVTELQNCVKYSDPGAGNIGDIRLSVRNLEAESAGKWILTDGRELSVQQHQELYSLIGASGRKSAEYTVAVGTECPEETISDFGYTGNSSSNYMYGPSDVKVKFTTFNNTNGAAAAGIQIKNGYSAYVVPYSDMKWANSTTTSSIGETTGDVLAIFNSSFRFVRYKPVQVSDSIANGSGSGNHKVSYIIALFPTEKDNEIGIIRYYGFQKNTYGGRIEVLFYNVTTDSLTMSSYDFKPELPFRDTSPYSINAYVPMVTSTAVYIGMSGSARYTGNNQRYYAFSALMRYKFSDRSIKALYDYDYSSRYDYKLFDYKYYFLYNDYFYRVYTTGGEDPEKRYQSVSRASVDSLLDKFTTKSDELGWLLNDYSLRTNTEANGTVFYNILYDLRGGKTTGSSNIFYYSFGKGKYFLAGSLVDDELNKIYYKTSVPGAAVKSLVFEDTTRYYFVIPTTTNGTSGYTGINIAVYTKSNGSNENVANPSYTVTAVSNFSVPFYMMPMFLSSSNIQLMSGGKPIKLTMSIDNASTFTNLNLSPLDSSAKYYIRCK